MKDGELIEMGNHSELLKNYPNGTYSGFVAKQQSAEEDNDDIDDLEPKDDKIALLKEKSVI